MDDDRLTLAIARLDKAIARLEKDLPDLVARPRASVEIVEDDEANPSLRERHEALRARTSAAVERLSQLLDTAGGAA